ncbi:MAG: permease prefix domain 1-containing protein [Clostridiales Family XIII bacterium]|jgi:hypothetical protein|nr:permease prefix domain 1-containing protein [Clostridiales Family XIII bacterium]
MNTRQQIDSLFSGYEKTAGLSDFMEELESNLNDRIASLKQKGMGEQEAFDKALAELGDISSLADDLSLKRKQDVFSEMYMKTRNYISPVRMALYVICGALIGFGLITGVAAWLFSSVLDAFLGTALIFCGSGVLVVVFLGLTQETSANEAMSWKRALWYVLSVGALIFGVFVFVNAYFTKGAGLPVAIASLIPFFLPGMSLGVFLILTEKDRSKPWVAELRREAVKSAMHPFGSPGREERFGLICGALWIAGIAGFVLLTITVGFKFSWLALVAALVVQLLVQSAFMKADGKRD